MCRQAMRRQLGGRAEAYRLVAAVVVGLGKELEAHTVLPMALVVAAVEVRIEKVSEQVVQPSEQESFWLIWG